MFCVRVTTAPAAWPETCAASPPPPASVPGQAGSGRPQGSQASLGPALTQLRGPGPPSPPPKLPAAGDSWRPCPTWPAPGSLASSQAQEASTAGLGWAVFPIAPPSRPHFVPFSPSQQLWAGQGAAAVTGLQAGLRRSRQRPGAGGEPTRAGSEPCSGGQWSGAHPDSQGISLQSEGDCSPTLRDRG